ncbi:heavy-metal-associated domain-containing protein [Flavobacterium enshiense]|uniref:heavy-metal-associated domain-containing protein n=1 Tax=Flavobacterium enshiense TaxID=1341165 RepID=UPI00345D7ED3
MKKTIFIALIMLTGFISNAQIKSASIQASGLTCSMCSNSIYKSLKKVSFIENVESDVEKSIFTIKFKENETVDLDAVHKAVEKTGFSISGFQFVMNVANLEAKDGVNFELEGKKFHFVDVKENKLNGDVMFRLINKNFVAPKEYKRLKTKLVESNSERIFNITI